MEAGREFVTPEGGLSGDPLCNFFILTGTIFEKVIIRAEEFHGIIVANMILSFILFDKKDK